MGLEKLQKRILSRISPRTDVWKKDRVEADQKKDPEFFLTL
tara:strand:- start:179 stop:301 length:123 start_codon:yes stop_codon:yes gene_type:complete